MRAQDTHCPHLCRLLSLPSSPQCHSEGGSVKIVRHGKFVSKPTSLWQTMRTVGKGAKIAKVAWARQYYSKSSHEQRPKPPQFLQTSLHISKSSSLVLDERSPYFEAFQKHPCTLEMLVCPTTLHRARLSGGVFAIAKEHLQPAGLDGSVYGDFKNLEVGMLPERAAVSDQSAPRKPE